MAANVYIDAYTRSYIYLYVCTHTILYKRTCVAASDVYCEHHQKC